MRTVVLGVSALVVGFASTARAQSIDPSSFSGTMNVGQSITIHKTITLGEFGANLVDLFFLADNTGSMGTIIANAKAGASAILGNVPAGADYAFGVGMYRSDLCEGVDAGGGYSACSGYPISQPVYYTPPAYQQNAALGGATAAQAAINTWNAYYGGDIPEANFYALQQMANTADWRTGSQRLVVWFGDAPSHTETTTEAQAIAALQAAGVTVIAFNSNASGYGLDGCYGTECSQASDIVAATGGSLTNNFTSLTTSAFVSAVNAAIETETKTLDLVFGTDFFSIYSGGLSFAFTCTDALGCLGVNGGESRTFDVTVTALAAGTYDFSVFAQGVSAAELDHIVVLGEAGVVPEPSTWMLLGTGLLALGFVGWRRRDAEGAA